MKTTALLKRVDRATSILNSQSAIRHSLVPTVDAVMLEERAATFTKRSIKTSAKPGGSKWL